MNHDEDLKKMKSLLDEAPNPKMIQQWQSALANRAQQLRRRQKTPWLQLAVAASVGFIVGAIAFSQPNKKSPELEVSSREDATIEYIYTNNN